MLFNIYDLEFLLGFVRSFVSGVYTINEMYEYEKEETLPRGLVQPSWRRESCLDGKKRRGSMLHDLLKTRLGHVGSARCVLAQRMSDVLDRNLVGLS